jgi:hypothetical protein
MGEAKVVFHGVMVLPKEFLCVRISAEIDLALHLIGKLAGGLDRRNVPGLAFMRPSERCADSLVSKEERDLLILQPEGQARAFQVGDVMAASVPRARRLEEVGEVRGGGGRLSRR